MVHRLGTLPSPSRLAHTFRHPGVPTVVTRTTASTALGHGHTPACQSPLTAREATGQGPHTTCSLLPGARARAPPPWRSVRQSHPEANRQGTRERARQQVQTRAWHEGTWASTSRPCLRSGPRPQRPGVLTWQAGKVSWCCSKWPTAKSRTLANVAWCRRNRVRSSESSSGCRCVDTSRGN